MKLSLLLAIPVIVASTGGLGCKKSTECNAMIAVINPATDKIKAGAPGDKAPSTSNRLKNIAQVAEATSAELAKQTVTTPQLKKMSEEYQAMCKEISGAAVELAAVAEALAKAKSQVDAASKEMDQASEKIGKTCAVPTPPADCQKLLLKMKEAPPNPDKAEEVRKFIGEFETMELSEPALKDATAQVTKSLQAQAKLLVEIKGLEIRAKGADAAMVRAGDKEQPLIQNLNKFCSN